MIMTRQLILNMEVICNKDLELYWKNFWSPYLHYIQLTD